MWSRIKCHDLEKQNEEIDFEWILNAVLNRVYAVTKEMNLRLYSR